MVNPQFLTLKRRAQELYDTATHISVLNEDAGALLLFYATECALKAAYLQQNNLKTTEDARANGKSARSFVHDLVKLAHALNIPRSVIGSVPKVITNTGDTGHISDLHQAWRYGVKITDTPAICVWLKKLIEWCSQK